MSDKKVNINGKFVSGEVNIIDAGPVALLMNDTFHAQIRQYDKIQTDDVAKPIAQNNDVLKRFADGNVDKPGNASENTQI